MEKIRSLPTISVSTFIASKECLERPRFFESVVDAIFEHNSSIEEFNREIALLRKNK